MEDPPDENDCSPAPVAIVGIGREYCSYKHRQKCWEGWLVSPFPPLPSHPLLQCWISFGINCPLNIRH